MKSLPELNDLHNFSNKEARKVKTIYRRAAYLKGLQDNENIRGRDRIRSELGALIWMLNDAGAFDSDPVELYDCNRNQRRKNKSDV